MCVRAKELNPQLPFNKLFPCEKVPKSVTEALRWEERMLP